MTRAPGSIDNGLHKSEKNRETNKTVLRYALVLPIAAYNTHTQKENRGNLVAMLFSKISIGYFVTSLYREFLRCCPLVVSFTSLMTAVIRFENYANLSSRFSKCFSHIIYKHTKVCQTFAKFEMAFLCISSQLVTVIPCDKGFPQ